METFHNRAELSDAISHWLSLPMAIQLEFILAYGAMQGWNTLTLAGEIRHWMTMSSIPEQISVWGESLYGTSPHTSAADGHHSMAIMQFAAVKKPR